MDKNNSINLKKLIFPAIGCSTSSFLIIFVVFVSALITLGIIESEAGDGSSSSNLAYESECNYEATKVTVMDGSNTKVLATVSLEDYILGVVCPEIGACSGNVASMSEHYLKTKFVATRTYVLARGKYNSSSKSITIRASTRDQQWCDLEHGCIVTVDPEKVPGYDTHYMNTYPGNYDEKQMIGTFSQRYSYTEEDLTLLHQYYQDTYGELYLNSTYDGVITSLNSSDATSYKSGTQLYWKSEAARGQTYIQILKSTGSSGKPDAEDYVGKQIYKLGDYCKSKTPSISANTSTDYVNWMIEFAANDEHGYSMDNRSMNPDVDCSSFVYYALLNNGYTTSQLGSYPFATGSMESILTGIGFEQIPFDVNSLEEGDILWYPKGFKGHSYGHTEVYIGNGQSVGAHSNYDGITGDSAGNEVSVVSVAEYQSVFRKK